MIQIIALYEPRVITPWYFGLFFFLFFLLALSLPFMIRFVVLRRPVINLWSAVPLTFICSFIILVLFDSVFLTDDELSDYERYVLSYPDSLKESGLTALEIDVIKYTLEQKSKQKNEDTQTYLFIATFAVALIYSYCVMHIGYRDYCIKRLIEDETDIKSKDEQKQ